MQVITGVPTLSQSFSVPLSPGEGGLVKSSSIITIDRCIKLFIVKVEKKEKSHGLLLGNLPKSLHQAFTIAS